MDLKRKSYEAASFVRHLRDYYRLHIRRTSRHFVSGHPGNAIFLDRQRYFVPPRTSSVTQAVWTQHACFTGAREDRMFLKLREGCKSLLDIGCAEGYYSAVFAATAETPSQIVAVDLSPEMVRWHREVIEGNKSLSGQPIDWRVVHAAISDREDETTLGEALSGEFVTWYDKDPNSVLAVKTLPKLIEKTSIQPDLIKFDVESYEYEIVLANLDWFRRYRPRLHFELHAEMMRERGKSAEKLLEALLSIYRISASEPADYRKAPISHLSFVPRARLEKADGRGDTF